VDINKTQFANRRAGPILPRNIEKSILRIACGVLLFVTLGGCAPTLVEESRIIPTLTINDATTTPVPSSTWTPILTPSSTPVASSTAAATHTPEAAVTTTSTPDSPILVFYCVKSGSIDATGVMPENAIQAQRQPGQSSDEGDTFFIDIPKGGFSMCRAQYRNLLPDDYELKISEGAPEGAFLKVPMASQGDGYEADVKHYYILQLPVLTASFNMAVVGTDGEVYRQDQLEIQNRFFIPIEPTPAPPGRKDPGEATKGLTKVPTSYTLHP